MHKQVPSYLRTVKAGAQASAASPYTLIGNGGYNQASAAAACSRAMDRRGQTPIFACFA